MLFRGAVTGEAEFAHVLIEVFRRTHLSFTTVSRKSKVAISGNADLALREQNIPKTKNGPGIPVWLHTDHCHKFLYRPRTPIEFCFLLRRQLDFDNLLDAF